MKAYTQYLTIATLLVSATTAAAQNAGPSTPAAPAVSGPLARPATPAALPPLPETSPQQLAAAQTVAARVFPNGTYRLYMERDMPRWTDSLIEYAWGMTEKDIAALMPQDKKTSDVTTLADKRTLGEVISGSDPYMRERISIGARVVFRHIGPMLDRMEGPFRDSFARNLAQRMSVRDLNNMAAFLNTPAGRSFADAQMASWLPDPRAMMAMMRVAPQFAKDLDPKALLAEVEAATAHLPKPQVASWKYDPRANCDGDAACLEQVAIDEESGDEPWYDSDNWTAAEQRSVARLEADAERKETAYRSSNDAADDARRAAQARARAKFKAQGWKPKAKANNADADAAQHTDVIISEVKP